MRNTWIHRWWIFHCIVTLVYFLGGANRLMFDKFHDDVQSVCSPEKAPIQKWVKWSFSTLFTTWFSKKNRLMDFNYSKRENPGSKITKKIKRIWRHHHMRHKNPEFEYPMPSNTPTNDVKISVEADVICLFFQNKHHSSHPKIPETVRNIFHPTELNFNDHPTWSWGDNFGAWRQWHDTLLRISTLRVQMNNITLSANRFQQKIHSSTELAASEIIKQLDHERIMNENPWKLPFMTPGSEQHVFFFRFRCTTANGK